MTLRAAKEKAEQAAEAARQRGDEPLALLAEAVAEMARSLNQQLHTLSQDIKNSG